MHKLLLISVVNIALIVAQDPTPEPEPQPCIYDNTVCHDFQECFDKMYCSDKLVCAGGRSCAESSIVSDTLSVWGRGSLEALEYCAIEERIDFYASFLYSDSDSEIRLATKNYFHAGRIGQAVYTTEGVENVYIEVSGHYALTGAEIWCKFGSVCDVKCISGCFGVSFYVEAGARLSVDCVHPGSCGKSSVYYEGDGICLTGEGSSNLHLAVAIPERTLLTSPNVKKSIQERKLNKIYQCNEQKSCKNEVITLPLECNGSQSCEKATSKADVPGTIHCNGYQSCKSASLFADSQTVTCGGFQACKQSMSKVNDIYYSGKATGETAVVLFSNIVYADGMDSFKNGLAVCAPGPSCALNCKGDDSCKNAVLDCSAVNRGKSSCDAYVGQCGSTPECLKDAKVTIIQRCADQSSSDCKKSKYCAWNSTFEQCFARRTYCNGHIDKTACEGNNRGSFCKFSNGVCKLKSSKVPSLYKKYASLLLS